MDFDTYATLGVELANARLDDLADLRAFLADEPWSAERATDADVPALRDVGTALHAAFALAAEGKDAETVAALNTVLNAHPVHPRISGHDASDWHLHVTRPGAPVAEDYAVGGDVGASGAAVRAVAA